MSQESIDKFIKHLPAYQVGYLKGAMKVAMEMLHVRAVEEAETQLRNAVMMVEQWNKETDQAICSHEKIRESWQGCVVDYYCQDCGKWMGDKDVS